DLDDLHLHVLVHRYDLLCGVDVTVGELRDVHEPLDAVGDAHERAERDELGDLTLDDLTRLVQPRELAPRIFLRLLERQRDALALEVDVEDLDLDLLPDLNDLARMLDVPP